MKKISGFIYIPDEDTFLLLKWARRFCKNKKVLEVGCGSGYIIENLRDIAKEVLGVDINPYAVEYCRKRGLNVVQSDLFENVKGKFDIILFNPPYLPEDDVVKDYWERVAIYGGKEGNEIIIRFLKEAKSYLNENGIILFIISSLSNPQKVFKTFEKEYEFKILEKISVFFEELYCVLAVPKN